VRVSEGGEEGRGEEVLGLGEAGGGAVTSGGSSEEQQTCSESAKGNRVSEEKYIFKLAFY
jgi:hypothetical protein